MLAQGDALGEFLRREGVHEADLAECRGVTLVALGTRVRTPAVSGDARRLRELERELLRKDRALAETAALFVLKKRPRLVAGRGRQHEEGDRQVIVAMVAGPVDAGPRRDRACQTIGLSARMSESSFYRVPHANTA